MKTVRKIGTELSRIVLGLTFIFSGFVKSVDPYGTAYKVADYLAAFNLSFFSFLEMPISFFLCGFEFALGIIVLLGIYPKWSSRLMLLTMIFMTPLTLYLAIADPVSDCGCFGDALVISNWETFFKNIILSILAIILLINYKHIKPFLLSKMYVYALSFIIVFSTIFLFYNYIYDPIIDFRPYKVGTNIPEQMMVSEDKLPVTENVFIYEKNGVKQAFTEDNYPWQDSTWTFISMDAKVIKEGELPPISDFSINEILFNEVETEIINSFDITDNVLANNNYSFLIIAPFLSKIKMAEKQKFEAIAEYAKKENYNIYLLTSSSSDDIIRHKQTFNKDIKFCISDEKVLKTIIRSNPSVMILKNGTIIAKWAKILIPNKTAFDKPIDKIIAEHSHSKNNILKLLIVSIVLLIPLIIIKIVDVNKNK